VLQRGLHYTPGRDQLRSQRHLFLGTHADAARGGPRCPPHTKGVDRWRRTVAVSSEGTAGLTAAIQAQVAAIQTRGSTVVSVHVTSPWAVTITYTDSEVFAHK
jgi:hypothetical protein